MRKQKWFLFPQKNDHDDNFTLFLSNQMASIISFLDMNNWKWRKSNIEFALLKLFLLSLMSMSITLLSMFWRRRNICSVGLWTKHRTNKVNFVLVKNRGHFLVSKMNRLFHSSFNNFPWMPNFTFIGAEDEFSCVAKYPFFCSLKNPQTMNHHHVIWCYPFRLIQRFFFNSLNQRYFSICHKIYGFISLYLVSL